MAKSEPISIEIKFDVSEIDGMIMGRTINEAFSACDSLINSHVCDHARVERVGDQLTILVLDGDVCEERFVVRPGMTEAEIVRCISTRLCEKIGV